MKEKESREIKEVIAKNGISSEIGTSVEMISRNEGIFGKTMFGFKQSRAKVPYKLKTQVRNATLAKVMPDLSIY